MPPPRPPSAATPDSSTAPAAPDTNAAPATNAAPSSTMNLPTSSLTPFLVRASYHPSDRAAIQVVSTMMGQATAPAPEPATAPAPAPAIPDATTPAPQAIAAPAATAPSEPAGESPVPNESSVIVLLYHQFKPAGVAIPAKYQWTMNVDHFEAEMKYIHDNGYHVVPLSDVIRFIKHEITLPPGSVAITIDDGYKSAIVYAAPILKKYGYPWTFFIYPEFITTAEGSGAASWNDLLQLQSEGIDIESHSMTPPEPSSSIIKSVKGVWQNFTPEQYDAWLTNETAGSKAILEQRMSKPITCFAYPYGEYDKTVEAHAIAAGYEAIFTVADNPVHSTTNLHSIGRYTITQGVERDFAAYLRQSALSLTKADPEPGATITNPRPTITARPESARRQQDRSPIDRNVGARFRRRQARLQTNTLRLYLPRDLIQPVALVNIRAKDAATGLILVANWHFNYQPAAGTATPHARPPLPRPHRLPLPQLPAPPRPLRRPQNRWRKRPPERRSIPIRRRHRRTEKPGAATSKAGNRNGSDYPFVLVLKTAP